MISTRLSQAQSEKLQWIARSTRSAKELRRAQALLDLDAGEAATEVARRWGVHRSTLYDWLGRFLARWQEREVHLRDAERSGRPPRESEQATAALRATMPTEPGSFGYRATNWTTPLLLHHLKRLHQVEASESTLRRTLHGLGYRWKRPRFVLARRPAHWRQAKGGSKGA